MKEAIDPLIAPLLSKYAHIGIAVGVVDREQTAVFGYGKVNKARPVVPDGETFFEIGSITKVFTALLLASMVEEELVSLETPLRALLPAFPDLPEDITLLRLATHTSGFPRLPSNLFWSAIRNRRNPYAHYSPARLHAYLARYKGTSSSSNPPSYLYSNLGFGVLGYALGQKLGVPYEQAVISRICEPLAMFDTRCTLTSHQRQRLAAPHTAKGKPTLNWALPTLAGAGALRSTSQDMLKFLMANLGQISTPLQSVLELCQRIQVEQPVPQSDITGIALGWHISSLDQDSPPVYWHNGGTGGYRSFTGFIKESRSGVVVLSNYGLASTPEIDRIGMAVLKELASANGRDERE